jgi:hypothetical protein
MKREPHQRNHGREQLAVSISTVEACVGAASPPIDEATSLTLRGELLPARKPKRYMVVTVRRCYPGSAVTGRVFPKGRALNAWINLPPVFFADALTLALSGGLRLLELTTGKLRRNAGEILAARFVTRDLRSYEPVDGNAIRENPAIGAR